MKPGMSAPSRVPAALRPGVRSFFWAMAWVVALSFGLCACNGAERNKDMPFGESFRQVFANQRLNPDAGAEGTPVTGLDGKKAANIVGNYQNKPAPAKGGKSSGASSGSTDVMLLTPKDGGSSEK